jgi:peptidyl-prolyl cis-trans isomerase D
VLDLEALKKNIASPRTSCASTTPENEKRFTAPRKRRASHILIKADKDAPKAEREKAKAKAGSSSPR